jgi:hypothetical protein
LIFLRGANSQKVNRRQSQLTFDVGTSIVSVI